VDDMANRRLSPLLCKVNTRRRAACYVPDWRRDFRNNRAKYSTEGSGKLRKKSVAVETVQVVSESRRDGQC